MADQPVFLVVTKGLVFVAGYWQADSAELHARCITGGTTQMLIIRDAVPAEVLDDVMSEDDLDAGWTPVAGVPVPVDDPGSEVVGSRDAGASDAIPDAARSEGSKGPHRTPR